MRPRRSGGRDVPAFGRALGAPFAPHAPFADVGAECEIVAHQELVDGRLLVRCRAKRRASLGREGRPRRGGVPRRARGTRRGRRGGGARRENSRDERIRRDAHVPPDASAPDASRTSTPLTARVAARAGLQRDSIGPRVADQRDWATTALLGERATAMHQAWLARVAGRPAAPHFPARRRRDPRLCSDPTFYVDRTETTWIICLGGAARVRARIDSTISRGG